MSKLIVCVLLAVSLSFGASVVNTRLVPDTTDFTAQGSQSLRKAEFLLMKDLANILPATAGGDGINVDSIRSNPNVDSLAGNIVFSGRPTFTDLVTLSDSTAIGAAGAGNLRVGGGSDIDSIAIIDGAADTLVIKIGGKAFKFVPTGNL